jgi:hypothetical protein
MDHTGDSSAWLERVVWAHEVASSNLALPTDAIDEAVPGKPRQRHPRAPKSPE